MSKYVKLLFAGLLSLSTSAEEQQAQEAYLSKAFWKELQWDKASSTPLWRSSTWSPYTGEQSSKLSYEKARLLAIDGIDFNAYLGQQRRITSYPLFASISATVKQSQCKRLATLFTQQFGKPLENDSSTVIRVAESSYVKTVMLEYQWDVGTTRINGSCSGVTSDRDEGKDADSFFWSVTYRHISTIEKLVPKFALSCTRQLSFVGRQEPQEDIGNIVFWVNPSTKSVLTPTQSILAVNAEIGPETISFRDERDEHSTQFSISRITGQLTANVYRQGRKVAQISGICEKQSEIKPKF